MPTLTYRYNDLDGLRANPPSGVGFACGGSVIFDPWQDPTLRPTDPSSYGFRPHHTGGGCMALRTFDDDGNEILLTGPDGSDVPDEDDDAGWMMGAYDRETGDELWLIDVHDHRIEDGYVRVKVYREDKPEVSPMTVDRLTSVIYAADALWQDRALDLTTPETAELLHTAIYHPDRRARWGALNTVRDALARAGHDEDAIVSIVFALEGD